MAVLWAPDQIWHTVPRTYHPGHRTRLIPGHRGKHLPEHLRHIVRLLFTPKAQPCQVLERVSGIDTFSVLEVRIMKSN